VAAIVLGAVSAWLWLRDSPEPPPVEPARTRAAHSNDGVSMAGDMQPDPAIEAALAKASGPGVPTDAATSQESRVGAGSPALERRLMQDAGHVEAERKLIRLTTRWRYPDIARVLDLTPESAERLLEILADYRVWHRNSATEKSGTGAAEFELTQQEREFALDSAVAASIGQAKMPRYEQYMASLPERYQARDLQVLLMNSPDPLTFEDAERVIEAMYDERRRIERDLTAIHGASEENDYQPPAFVVDGKKIAGLDAGSNERIFAAAARHLSPVQARAFRRLLDDGVEQDRLWEEMQRIRSEAKAAQP